jgi:hypothetical protein
MVPVGLLGLAMKISRVRLGAGGDQRVDIGALALAHLTGVAPPPWALMRYIRKPCSVNSTSVPGPA